MNMYGVKCACPVECEHYSIGTCPLECKNYYMGSPFHWDPSNPSNSINALLYAETKARKAGIMVGCKVGQSVGLLERRFIFYFVDTRV